MRFIGGTRFAILLFAIFMGGVDRAHTQTPPSPKEQAQELRDAIWRMINRVVEEADIERKKKGGCGDIDFYLRRLKQFSDQAYLKELAPLLSDDQRAELANVAALKLDTTFKDCPPPIESTTAAGRIVTPPVANTEHPQVQPPQVGEREDRIDAKMKSVEVMFRNGVEYRKNKDCVGFLETVKALEDDAAITKAWYTQDMDKGAVDLGGLPKELVEYSKNRARDLKGLWPDCPKNTATTGEQKTKKKVAKKVRSRKPSAASTHEPAADAVLQFGLGVGTGMLMGHRHEGGGRNKER